MTEYIWFKLDINRVLVVHFVFALHNGVVESEIVTSNEIDNLFTVTSQNPLVGWRGGATVGRRTIGLRP